MDKKLDLSSIDILKDRIFLLGSKEPRQGKCVLYVMSRDQRVSDNHALLCAQKHALAKGLPLAVVFCLYPSVKHRSREQYQYMIDGLKQVEQALDIVSIAFMMLIGRPKDKLRAAFEHLQPDAVYFDFSPLRGPRRVQDELAGLFPQTAMYIVDTHNTVPLWIASDKKEIGAYTMRPKLHRLFGRYLVEPEVPLQHPHKWTGQLQRISQLETLIEEVLEGLPKNQTNLSFVSGEDAAKAHLENFIATKLPTYAADRNNPEKDAQSDLSPYLHFGQISALRVALRLQQVAKEAGGDLHLLHSSKMPKPDDTTNGLLHGIDALLEEMIVRKELADNFCYYETHYDSVEAAPQWAKASLKKHETDVREVVYSTADFERAQTHDAAWNAAQSQLIGTGKMHGYMRMYWAKKVLEWSKSPEEAFKTLVYLNDHYSIDGSDPNGYAGIAWSVAGVHDRPWAERSVYGVIRCMVYDGLKRKFDITAYENQWKK